MGELSHALDTDGVIHLKGLLDAAALQDAFDAWAWSFAHPGPGYLAAFPDDPRARQDLGNPAAREAYRPMLARSPLPRLLADLWGGSPVWFMYEQVFHKRSASKRTPWHQDTPYLPVEGAHLAVAWITFDAVSRDEALEYVLGSHRGPLYNGASFSPGDDTDPFYRDGEMPRMPDIEASRDDWPIHGWETAPGDVVIFHPSLLHGGGATGADRERRTLSLRFFGDDAVYVRRPGETPAPRVTGLHEALAPGARFRHPAFQQLI
jgi:ectoine hydroxylase-related dioxygenase (phytanoyl-CoA dioxygenase family)